MPGRLSRGGSSFQFGRASAPMIPQLVLTIRGAEGRQRDVIRPAIGAQHRLCRQFQQDTSSTRTPSSQMLPSAIGPIGRSKRAIQRCSLGSVLV
jgi:hypothetical protein